MVKAAFLTAPALALALIGSVCCADPLYYSGTLPDADGMEREITFVGVAEGARISGVVRVEGNDLTVSGTKNDDGSLALDIAVVGAGPLGTVTLTPKPALGGDSVSPESDFPFGASYELGGRTGAIANVPSLDRSIQAGLERPVGDEPSKRRTTRPRILASMPPEDGDVSQTPGQ